MHKFRRTAVCLLLLMLVTLAGCGGPGEPKGEEPEILPEEPVITEPVEPAEPENLVTTPVDPIEEQDPEPTEEEPPAEEEPEEPSTEQTEPIVAAKPSNGSYGEYSEESYDQLVADVLASITTSDMTKLEKAKAIWDYAKGKIRYTGDSDKSDWKQGAFTGMTAKQGDCFTYYAVSRALLTAAGIDNLEVTRLGGPTSHWWNLVNCGDGWYHFDATPRSSKMPSFTSFMFTDAEAADYTARAGRSYYSFDGSLLPPRAGSEETVEAPAKTEAPKTETPAAQPEDTAPAAEDTEPETTDPAEIVDPEPVLPEDEIPFDANTAGTETETGAETVTEMEMPDWLKPVDSDGDAA